MEKVNEENKFDNKLRKEEEEAEEKESPFKNSTFNIFDALFVLVSMGLLVADLVTDMIVTCKYFAGGDIAWGALTLGFILAPSIILQVFSVRWYMVDDDMSALKWITHICQVGPLHRYVNLFITGMEARRTKDPVDFERLFYQQSDVCMLRLFESFMESAPQVVLQLYIMVATNDENFWTGTSAAVSLFSLCWALGAYSRAHRKVRRDKKIVSWPGLVLQTIWRIGMISSRVMALVLFASVFKAYIFLAVGVHWIGMMIWVHLQKTDFCSNPLEERLFNCVVAIIYVFCFFNLKEGKSRKRVLVFYSIMFIENTALLLVWYHYRTIGEWYNVAGFTIVFGGFGIGVVSMVLYYRYLHPRNDFSLCGPNPEKKPSRSLNTTPSVSPSSSHAALFSPELYRHGHSPSPKQQRHSDENHNENVDSPLARPLSQTSIDHVSDFDKEHGMPHRSSKVKGESHGVGKGDSAVRKSKSESCVCYSEDETGSITVNLDKNTAGNTSIMTNASLLASFRCDISGFGADLVQRFDDWRDHSHLTNHMMMSANSKTGNMSRSLGSMLDQSHLSASHCMDSVTPAKTQRDANTPAFSPDLPQMPEITDSPNKIMTAYEAQQIYDSILGTHHPCRNSKRKLHFDKDSRTASLRTASGRERSKSGSAVLQNKPTQKEVGNRSCRDVSVNRGPQRVCVTSKYIQDGSSVGNIGTSGQMSLADTQLHNTLTNVATKDKDSSKCSLRSHKTSIHQVNNSALESKSKEVHEDEKRNETEITNSQDLILDVPIDLNGEKPLEDSNGNDLQHVLNERQKGFQNQNKPLIMNVDVNNPCAEVGIGIASPRLRAALAKDLFKAKQKVMSASSKDVDKANVHSRGINKAMPVVGYMVDDLVKGSTDGDKLSVDAKFAEEGDVGAGKGFDPNADIQMKDAHGTTARNSTDKTNQGHSGDAKHSSTEGRGNGNLVSEKAESSITKQEGRVCTNEIHKEQYNYSPSKAGKLFNSSLSPRAAIFGTSQARFNGSHSPLIGGKAPSGAGGSGHKVYGMSPAGKANLKRVRSLKGSVPSQSPSHPQGSNPTNDGRGEGLTDKVHENDHERTPIANLKGKIKRALSVKSKVLHENTALDSSPSVDVCQEPKMSEKHAETLNIFRGPVVNADNFDKALGGGRPVLVENQQIGRKSALSPQKLVEHPKNMTTKSPVKTGSEPLSLPIAVLSSSVGKENRGYTPVLGNQNTSPQKPSKGSAGASPQKIGKEHISPSKSNKVHTSGKENRAFAPGAVKGSVSRHEKEKSGSPKDKGKKPPRRSLGRIPTNLVAENVARFDSPGK